MNCGRVDRNILLLAVSALSHTRQWVNEFERFTPTIPVVLYHGDKEQRANLREWRMEPPSDGKKKKGSKTSKKRDSTYANTTQTFPIVVTS